MEELIGKWESRMKRYRHEADMAITPMTRVKAMNKFYTYRDCIKELKEAIKINSDEVKIICSNCDQECKPIPLGQMCNLCYNEL